MPHTQLLTFHVLVLFVSHRMAATLVFVSFFVENECNKIIDMGKVKSNDTDKITFFFL
jgi:hypothetical protein